MKPQTIITNLFQLLQAKKYDEVAKLYTVDAKFTDGIFMLEDAENIRKMWNYLGVIFTELTIKIVSVTETENGAIVTWESFYNLRGNKIHNKLKSEFVLINGRIDSQTDSFSFYRIARQTSGAKGVLFGWLPSVKKTIQSRMLIGFEQYNNSVFD